MKNILIFSQHTFSLSSTFIYRQVLGASASNTVFLASLKLSHEKNFPLPGVNRVLLKTYYGLMDRLSLYIDRKFRGKNARLSPAALKKLGSVIEENNIRLIHVHYGTWGVALLEILKATNVPFIVSFHGYDASRALNNKQYVSVLPDLFTHAAQVIIVSEHMRSALNLSAWNSKVALVPYGIDCNVFKRKQPLQTGGEIRILHSGRLASKKGVPDLIRVYARLKKKYSSISLHLLGDGDEMNECRELVSQCGVGNSVTFYGSKPLPEVIRLMNECHIFVLNSRTADNGDMEGLPNSILEAMSMEMAVVSTLHAGIPTAIVHDECGLLVPEKDNDGLFAALSSLIEKPDLIVALGSRARKRVEQVFTMERMQSQINEIYNNTLA
jgi:glycosyltransferase involved in cell wall biosynthesis